MKTRLYDAEFELENLTYESEEIFKEFYCNFLSGNREYINLVCSQEVAPMLNALIELRQKEGWKYKFEELLDCSNAFFMGAKIEKNRPCFTYNFEVQEFDAKVSLKDGSDFESETFQTKGLIGGTY